MGAPNNKEIKVEVFLCVYEEEDIKRFNDEHRSLKVILEKISNEKEVIDWKVFPDHEGSMYIYLVVRYREKSILRG